jgi:hypothetical protein
LKYFFSNQCAYHFFSTAEASYNLGVSMLILFKTEKNIIRFSKCKSSDFFEKLKHLMFES